MRRSRGRPNGRHVDEDLLGVPGEQGGEVSVERKADIGVLFFLFGVVVWATSYTIPWYTTVSSILAIVSS
jgi:hypothetical protein